MPRTPKTAPAPPELVQPFRLEIEDLVLVGWVLSLEFLTRWLGADWWQSAWIWVPALLALALCLFSLGPDDTSVEETELRRAVLGIPAAILLLGVVVRPGDSHWGRTVLIFLALTVGVNLILAFLKNFRRRLPRMERTPRRILVAPAELAGVALFESQIRPDLLNTAFVAAKPSGGRLTFLVLATLLLYWSAVVGPRILAGGTKSPLVWGPRCLLYLASVVFTVHRAGGW
jgi:hypothetical protein